MKYTEMLCLIIISCALSFGLSRYFFLQELDLVYAELDQRPKIAVADYMKIAELYPDGADAEKLERTMAQYTYQIRKTGEQGYLVLSSQSISYAPDALVLKPDSESVD